MAFITTGLNKLAESVLGGQADSQSISNNAYNQWGPIQAPNSAVNSIGPTPGTVPILMGTAHTLHYLPAATGTVITITFTDAHGIAMAINVDQAYVGIMCQISNLHQIKKGVGVNKYPTQLYPYGMSESNPKSEPILEGEFSYDEMELAETIIEELESGEKARISREQEDIGHIA